MNLHLVSIALLFLYFLTAHGGNPTHLRDQILINCGSKGTSTAHDFREWLGDVKPKFSSPMQIKGSSSTAKTVIRKFISADPVLHRTARISRSKFSYEFEVSPGQKIIRLHFHPTSYRGFTGFKDLFTTESGHFILLGNFSASLFSDALGVNTFVKEFCLIVPENGKLVISFYPSSVHAYAFINGIEIISVPASLSYFHSGEVGVQVVGQKTLVYVDYGTVLELIHRVSIKQSLVPSVEDFAMWATRKANKQTSSTWKIPMDVGFRYLIRLHFSESALKITETDNVIFKVRINEMTLHTNIEIVNERKDYNIPWYKDYLVAMTGNRKEGKRDLLISLESYDDLIDGHGLIVGFELFKLSNHDNSLASPNPSPLALDSPTLFSFFGHRNAIATIATTLIALVSVIVHKSREIWEASSTEEENKPSARAERLCRRFSFAEIQLATENFSYALLIGKGGFGRVYKGLIDKGQNIVAVKRLKLCSKQGSHEFLTEIEMLSELRHVNLVSLIGYCNEYGEMILVYDYMGCGTLADHLYKLQRETNNCCSLTWKQRLDICIGAARGLDYLHTGQGIIHRDVKASNILLDENFVAKISDFGLAKPEDKSKLKSYISTKVKGTFGYLDPYYLNTHKLTRKSDTYAFGVVLLEVLCGRPAVDPRDTENKRILFKWAQENIKKGQVDQIVASCLRGEVSKDSLKTFVGVAERCLCDEPKNRPTMSQVVLQLESALEQQENKQNVVLNETSVTRDDIHLCNGENDLSAIRQQPTLASQEEPIFTPDMEKQTNDKVINTTELESKRKDGRRSTKHKQLRLWPWDGLWNRVKPSKKNESLSYEIREDLDEAGTKLAEFDWDTITAATYNFSFWNKVGAGGFGSVYKAILPTGQVVAVKRLSPSSGQGLPEFKNEIFLLPNLQHPNIIELVGYCIHGEECLLVYEFMENTSLDIFIGDKELCSQLFHWPVRFKIIMGIARGLVYLHQDSGLRVIHRDPSPRNILLDIDMNPKISDFGLARTFEEHQSELETTQVCGTSEYIAPEFWCYGKLSIKSDVYSFGVITLEIISGRRARPTICNQKLKSLLDLAWKLWNEKKALELVDESLGGAFPVEEALRCIKVGLLCVQWQPEHRPTMPSVIKMLEGDEVSGEPQYLCPPFPTEELGSRHANEVDSDNSTCATFEFDDTLER